MTWSVKCLLCIHVRSEHRHLQSSVGEVETRQSLELMGCCTEIVSSRLSGRSWLKEQDGVWLRRILLLTWTYMHVYTWTYVHTYFLLLSRLLVYFIFSIYWLLGPWTSKPLVIFPAAHMSGAPFAQAGVEGSSFPASPRVSGALFHQVSCQCSPSCGGVAG